MKKPGSIRKIVLVILVCALLILTGGWWLLCVSIYNDNFDKRFETYEPLAFRVEDFEGLKRTGYRFSSDRGQMLSGYMYSSGSGQKGILIIAHGFGAGHNSYMDCAAYFARNGYYVFAYDATGNDESEGEGVGGIPQGVIDLDHAVSFVEESGNFPDLPIVLFGHSWGGYSVCSVLSYHPEIKAVIECAGCNCSSDLFEAGGKEEAGSLIYAMMPFIKLHEGIRYGYYAFGTAMDGFAESDTAVMVLHSADDSVVPISYGYDLYHDRYGDDPRFVFVRFEDRGHNEIFTEPADTYKEEFNAGFDEWLAALEYDYTSDENLERFAADKAEYIHDHLDRKRWSSRLDEELFGQFLSFYNEHADQ